VTVVSRRRLRVRFWERGVGYTRASGTGAASAAVASIITGRAGREVTVECDGGELAVAWPEGGTVQQTGEVEVLFEGDWIGPAAQLQRRRKWPTPPEAGVPRSSAKGP